MIFSVWNKHSDFDSGVNRTLKTGRTAKSRVHQEYSTSNRQHFNEMITRNADYFPVAEIASSID